MVRNLFIIFPIGCAAQIASSIFASLIYIAVAKRESSRCNGYALVECGSGSSISGQCGSESGSKNLVTKSCTFLRVEVQNFQIKLQYIYPYRPPWRTSMVDRTRRSLRRSKHRAFYISFFVCSFLTTWIRIRIQPDQNQSRSMRTLVVVITEAAL